MTSARVTRWLTFVTFSTALLMANIDSTAVTVAFPAIGRAFSVDLHSLQWVVSCYFLAITAVLPFFGRIADVLGQSRVLNFGLLVFVCASLLVAVSPSFEVLILGRVVQGIGASMLMATSMAVAVAAFPPTQRGRVLGSLGSVVAAGTVLGPSVGGVLVDAFGWRAVFVVNLPIGLLGFTCGLFLPSTARDSWSVASLDLPGSALYAGSCVCLLLGLGAGSLPGLPPVAPAVLVALALAQFVLIVRRGRNEHAVIDLQLFVRRVFGLGCLAAALSFVIMLFPALLFPLYLYEVAEWSLRSAGLMMTVQAGAMLLSSTWAGRWSDRVGSRFPALLGLTLTALSMLATALFIDQDAPTWLYPLLLAGFGAGFGIFNSPNNSAIVGDLAAKQVAMGTVIISGMRYLGRAVGAALVVACYTLFAGSSAIADLPAPDFLAGMRGGFLVGTGLTVVAMSAVYLMERPGRLVLHRQRRRPQ